MREHGTGAKHNRGDEKNTTGLAHSRASRYYCDTNRKFGQDTEPAQARDAIRWPAAPARMYVWVRQRLPSSVSAAATRAPSEHSKGK